MRGPSPRGPPFGIFQPDIFEVGPRIILRNPTRLYFTVYEGEIADDLSSESYLH